MIHPPLTPAHPLDRSALISDPYRIQNMLLAQASFPSHLADTDKFQMWYSDRIPERWTRGWNRIKEEVLHGSFQDFTPAQLLSFGQAVAGSDMQVTGVAIVRYTNAATGYPCPVIYLVEQSATDRPMGFPTIPRDDRFSPYTGRRWVDISMEQSEGRAHTVTLPGPDSSVTSGATSQPQYFQPSIRKMPG